MLAEIKNHTLAKLTDKQVDVLDLLLDHMTTKEIARNLGISPNTVDQRLNSAKKILGTVGRSETAVAYRSLRDLCGKPTYEDSQINRKPFIFNSAPGHDDPAIFTLADGGLQSFDGRGRSDQILVPRVLNGPHGIAARLAYMFASAAGLLAVVLIGLSVAQALNGML